MQLVDLGDGHQVLGDHEHGEGKSLELQVAVLPEDHQREDDDDAPF